MALREELASWLLGRVTVVGVGDGTRGDDGVGPMVVDLLMARGVAHVINAASSPELETWRIRQAKPDTVLFVDAVDFGGSPGDVALLESNQLRSSGFDTHRAPLRLTMEYLEAELGSKCCLLALQPADVRQGAGMGREVRESAERVAEMIAELLTGTVG